ncbi:MAG: hypothetical protein ACKO45_04275 [Cyanobium sp.]
MLLNPPLSETTALRHLTVRAVVDLPLIRGAGHGDAHAIKALFCGFWPFVRDFQTLVRSDTFFPIDPLITRYGRAATVQTLRFMKTSLDQMAKEEGLHAELWRKGAHEAGFDVDALRGPWLPAVDTLLSFPRNHSPSSKNPHLFFCHLAATEYGAEEISRFLVQQEAFIRWFPESKRWHWGDIHLLDHGHGPSHLMIDEDLAQAYCPHPDPAAVVSEVIAHCISLFAQAGQEAIELFPSAKAPI